MQYKHQVQRWQKRKIVILSEHVCDVLRKSMSIHVQRESQDWDKLQIVKLKIKCRRTNINRTKRLNQIWNDHLISYWKNSCFDFQHIFLTAENKFGFHGIKFVHRNWIIINSLAQILVGHGFPLLLSCAKFFTVFRYLQTGSCYVYSKQVYTLIFCP